MFWIHKPHKLSQLVAEISYTVLIVCYLFTSKAFIFSFNTMCKCCFVVCAVRSNTLSINKSPESFRAFAFQIRQLL